MKRFSKIIFRVSIFILLLTGILGEMVKVSNKTQLWLTGFWIGLSGSVLEFFYSTKNSEIIVSSIKVVIFCSILILHYDIKWLGGYSIFFLILIVLFLGLPLVVESMVLPYDEVSFLGLKLGDLNTHKKKDSVTNSTKETLILKKIDYCLMFLMAVLVLLYISVRMYKSAFMIPESLRYFFS